MLFLRSKSHLPAFRHNNPIDVTVHRYPAFLALHQGPEFEPQLVKDATNLR